MNRSYSTIGGPIQAEVQRRFDISDKEKLIKFLTYTTSATLKGLGFTFHTRRDSYSGVMLVTLVTLICTDSTQCRFLYNSALNSSCEIPSFSAYIIRSLGTLIRNKTSKLYEFHLLKLHTVLDMLEEIVKDENILRSIFSPILPNIPVAQQQLGDTVSKLRDSYFSPEMFSDAIIQFFNSITPTFNKHKMVNLRFCLEMVYQSEQDTRPLGGRGVIKRRLLHGEDEHLDGIYYLSNNIGKGNGTDNSNIISSAVNLNFLFCDEIIVKMEGLEFCGDISPSGDDKVIRIAINGLSQKELALYDIIVFNTLKKDKFKSDSKTINTNNDVRRNFSTSTRNNRNLNNPTFKKCELVLSDKTIKFYNLEDLYNYIEKYNL